MSRPGSDTTLRAGGTARTPNLEREEPTPFFEAVGGGAPAANRLLLLSPHFPPGQGAGALRWEKMAVHAVARGWTVDVVTLDPKSLPEADFARLRRLPSGIRVFGIPAPSLRLDQTVNRAWAGLRRLVSPAALRRAADARAALELPIRPPPSVARAYFAWREHAIDGHWAAEASQVAVALTRRQAYRCVATSGPPHMVHEGGRRTSLRSGVPHVMDLRDPWSFVQRLPAHVASPLWRYLARFYESRTVAHAALVVMNTDASRRAMQAKYPKHSAKIIAVANGFDDDEPLPVVEPPTRFLIAYAGSIYIDRDPTVLFQAAARVIRELRLTPQDIGIEFMGVVDVGAGGSTRELARAAGVEPFVRLWPMQPRDEALRFLARASVLVTLHQDSNLAVPGKVFDYMRFNAWVLALTESGSATAEVLTHTSADIVSPTDVEGLAAVLKERYLQFSSGVRPGRIVQDDRLSRREQANHLLSAIETLPGTA